MMIIIIPQMSPAMFSVLAVFDASSALSMSPRPFADSTFERQQSKRFNLISVF